MTNLAKFTKSIERQKKGIEKVINSAHKRVALSVHNHLLLDSPIFSGYYAANHRITIGDTLLAELIPSTRKVKEGAHIGDIEPARVMEQQKLASLQPTDLTVIIGTAVPYAQKLETERGIYQAAAQNATREFTNRSG